MMDGELSQVVPHEDKNCPLQHSVAPDLSEKIQEDLHCNGNAECTEQNLALGNAPCNSLNEANLIESSCKDINLNLNERLDCLPHLPSSQLDQPLSPARAGSEANSPSKFHVLPEEILSQSELIVTRAESFPSYLRKIFPEGEIDSNELSLKAGPFNEDQNYSKSIAVNDIYLISSQETPSCNIKDGTLNVQPSLDLAKEVEHIPTVLSLPKVESKGNSESLNKILCNLPKTESPILVESSCKNILTTQNISQDLSSNSSFTMESPLKGASHIPSSLPQESLDENFDSAKAELYPQKAKIPPIERKPPNELGQVKPLKLSANKKHSKVILSPLSTYLSDSPDLEALDLRTASLPSCKDFLQSQKGSLSPQELNDNLNQSEKVANGISPGFSNNAAIKDGLSSEIQENIGNVITNFKNDSHQKNSSENVKSFSKWPRQNSEVKQTLSNPDFSSDKKSNIFTLDNLSLKSSDLESEEDWPLVQSRIQEVEKLEIQIDIVEENNKALRKENKALKEKLISQENEFQRQVLLLKRDLNEQLDKVQQRLSHAQRERDNMVVKYAQGEREVMKTKKLLEDSERRVKDLLKQSDQHLTKIKNLSSEKAKLSSTLDIRLMEISNVQKENERLKEEIKSRDIKIKWGQNKLKTEMDAHKDTQGKLESAILRQKEMREEAQQVRADCQEMMRHLQAAEEVRANSSLTPSSSLSSTESEALLRRDLEAAKQKLQAATEENNALTLKIHSVEKERLEHEEALSKLKEQLNAARQEVADVRARMAELEDLQLKLEREADRVQALQQEADRLRALNSDLQADMESCRAKEGELLQFTERLTTKSVRLQSDHTLLEAKAQQSKDEAIRLSRHCQELETTCKTLEEELEQVRHQKDQEIQLLIHHLADKTKSVELLSTRLEEAENEAAVLKRRHLTTVKALSRELQHSKRRLEALDGGDGRLPAGTISRASSNSSLDASHSHQPTASSPSSESNNKANFPQIDQRLLIERIIKLQKNLERKSEKLEFFQEHINVLHNELKKKSKIIQNYVLREETGALAPSAMDNNKHLSGKQAKIELIKRGGVMASVYGSHPADGALTLELSLEINNKLQTVLEETLLKNITLKENINTLGQEIARLSAQRTGVTP